MANKRFFDFSDVKFVGINLVLAILVTAAILIALFFWLKKYTQHGVEVAVENVQGLVVPEAEQLLAAQGLKMEVIDSTYSDKVPFGTIVEQNPKPDSHAKIGRIVYVTINATTKRQITMPNLQDMSYRQAETTLRGLGLKVDTVYDYEPSEFRDLVLDVKQKDESILPGQKIPIGTEVRLVIGFGRGTEKVEVPSVIGLTIQDARSLLLTNRLILGAVTFDEPQQEGLRQVIYHQSPVPGEILLEGETVAVKLSADERKATNAKNNTIATEEDVWF